MFAALVVALGLSVGAHHAMPDEAPQAAAMGHSMNGGHHAMAAMTTCLAVAAAVGLLALAGPPRWRTAARRVVTARRRAGAFRPAEPVIARARGGPPRFVVLRL